MVCLCNPVFCATLSSAQSCHLHRFCFPSPSPAWSPEMLSRVIPISIRVGSSHLQWSSANVSGAPPGAAGSGQVGTCAGLGGSAACAVCPGESITGDATEHATWSPKHSPASRVSWQSTGQGLPFRVLCPGHVLSEAPLCASHQSPGEARFCLQGLQAGAQGCARSRPHPMHPCLHWGAFLWSCYGELCVGLESTHHQPRIAPVLSHTLQEHRTLILHTCAPHRCHAHMHTCTPHTPHTHKHIPAHPTDATHVCTYIQHMHTHLQTPDTAHI